VKRLAEKEGVAVQRRGGAGPFARREGHAS